MVIRTRIKYVDDIEGKAKPVHTGFDRETYVKFGPIMLGAPSNHEGLVLVSERSLSLASKEVAKAHDEEIAALTRFYEDKLAEERRLGYREGVDSVSTGGRA